MGVSEGEGSVVGVVTGGDEATAEGQLRELLGATAADDNDRVEFGDEDTLRAFFDIGDAEIAVVDGNLESLVLERVALLDVEK